MTDMKTRRKLITLINEAIDSGASKTACCICIGLKIKTLQRWEKNKVGDKRSLIEKMPPNKLSALERKKVIDICCSDEYKDKTPNEIVPLLAEKGIYIASESTYYKILKEENLLKHRSESKPGKKRNKPKELKASGPNQVWSWDITYLRSNVKGMYFYLYMFMDVWSRKIVGWEIKEKESSENAALLVKKVYNKENVKNISLHSDNGKPMKGATMLATLQWLGVIPSFSRPRVSNDNPYSESLFKTLKYNVGYPKVFTSIEMATEWVEGFVDWYNTEHLHSGIKFVTPEQRHQGIDKNILVKRNVTYLNAREKHPERWSGKTRNWEWNEFVYLNPEPQEDLLTKISA